MSLKGPIIIIEDDTNDLDVIKAALEENEVKNEIKIFASASYALEYFMITLDLPFIILCDIRLPGMNGLEFRSAINQNEYLRKKSIPFIFYTAAVSQQIVNVAYDMTVQGFFVKPDNFDQLKMQLHILLQYWSHCVHPNNYSSSY